MEVEIQEEPLAALEVYAGIGIAFEVQSVLNVSLPDGGLRGALLSECLLETPYVKDYDSPGEGPLSWPDRFDVTRWGLLLARAAGRPVGGAMVAYDTPGLTMLAGRRDLAVVWDLRVSAEARGRRVGSALFRAAEGWAVARGCRWLSVETQNINVPACRFYAGQGCTLGSIDRFAYPDLPEEVQLVWWKRLAGA